MRGASSNLHRDVDLGWLDAKKALPIPLTEVIKSVNFARVPHDDITHPRLLYGYARHGVLEQSKVIRCVAVEHALHYFRSGASHALSLFRKPLASVCLHRPALYALQPRYARCLNVWDQQVRVQSSSHEEFCLARVLNAQFHLQCLSKQPHSVGCNEGVRVHPPGLFRVTGYQCYQWRLATSPFCYLPAEGLQEAVLRQWSPLAELRETQWYATSDGC
mmetsp:Transcript_95223/g.188674  ORF Transcript_95223/g.188674 Transcript_95223/m.188674 type:complete len:218 (+) Transcript_95223:88-741(+)